MQTLKKIGTFLLGGFRAGARTAGLSPKALGALIGAGVTGLLALVGLTPTVIADWISTSGVIVSPELVAVAITALAGKLAAVLLPPGNVVAKPAPAPVQSFPAPSTGTNAVARVEFSTGGTGGYKVQPHGSDDLFSADARQRLGLS